MVVFDLELEDLQKDGIALICLSYSHDCIVKGDEIWLPLFKRTRYGLKWLVEYTAQRYKKGANFSVTSRKTAFVRLWSNF